MRAVDVLEAVVEKLLRNPAMQSVPGKRALPFDLMSSLSHRLCCAARMLMFALVLFVTACGGSSNDAESEVSPAPTVVGEASEVLVTPSTDLTANHIDPPVSFANSPSIGGDHYPFWMNCGFYSVEVIEGAATHSLEHGAIWITYGESLPEGDVAELEALALANSRLLISPYDHQDPIVLSAWGAQQRNVQSATAPEIEAFITEWQDNPELVEVGASCSGAAGTPPDVVNTLIDGTEIPAEYVN